MMQDTLNQLRRQFLGLNRVLSTIMELVQDGLGFDEESALLRHATKLLVNNHNFQFSTIHVKDGQQLRLASAISSDLVLDPSLVMEESAAWVVTCEHLARQVVKAKTQDLVTRQAQESIYYAVPLIYRDETVAVIVVNSPTFDDNHQKLMRIFASILTSILINTRHSSMLNREVLRRTEELESAWQMAEQSSKAKSQFLTNMSHEFLTPLNTITGASDLLSEQAFDREQLNLLDSIHTSSSNLQAMVGDMLDYSLSESGELEFKSELTDIRVLVEQVIETYRPMADLKGLVINSTWGPSFPTQALVDPKRLCQILENLVSNAIKFTDKGGVTIAVTSDAISEVEAVVNFSVQDSGIGIDDLMSERIFDPFHQLDSSASRRFEGAGLGLSISQKVAALMGSKISVSSELGEGSNFYFSLRVPIEVEQSVKSNVSNSKISDYSTEVIQQYRVLLVEDNIINQKLAKKLLEKMGCKVAIANDGVDALDRFQNAAYDVIFMDCQMPNMDGYEATTKIRQMESGKRTPIIALTANSLPADRARSFEVGMDEFLTKPIVKEKLQSALTKWATH